MSSDRPGSLHFLPAPSPVGLGWLDTPVGKLCLAANDDALLALGFEGERPWPETPRHGRAASPVLVAAKVQLREYFAGRRRVFELPVAPSGTPFQLRVWRQIAAIPWGATATYGEIAAALEEPDAARAVGSAAGANPIPILIPCHRVIATGSSIGGFRGGAGRKAWLLRHEGQLLT